MATHNPFERWAFVRPLIRPLAPSRGGAVWALGAVWLASSGLALAAELDGFALKTSGDNSLQVILYTQGGRLDYRTEMGDQGLSVVLPGARLSPGALKNGLPVVRDAQNRVIGQIVPADANKASASGDVRIRIPNVSAKDYAVSVVQRAASTDPAAAPQTLAPVALPAMPSPITALPMVTGDAAFNSQFDAVTAGFSPPPVRYFSFAPAKSTAGASAYGASQRVASPRQYFPEWRPDRSFLRTARPVAASKATRATARPAAVIPESFGALALAAPRANVSSASSNPSADALPLPTSRTARASGPSAVADTATEATPLPPPAPDSAASARPDTPPSAQTTVASVSPWGLGAAPWWSIVLAALFFGGIGLFALTAGLLLFRFLVRPPSPRVILQTESASVLQAPAAAVSAPDPVWPQAASQEASPEAPPPLSSQSSAPSSVPVSAAAPEVRIAAHEVQTVGVVDFPAAMASEYWLPAADTLHDAVRHTARLKSSAGERRRRAASATLR